MTLTASRSRLGLAMASVAVIAGLTGCSTDAAKTTCGEFKEMSPDERIDLLIEDAEDAGEDSTADDLKALEGEDKTLTGEAVVSVCEGQSDDTELGDLDLE
jgi:hypothetical protein